MKPTIPLTVLLIFATLFLWQCNRTIYTKFNFPEKRISFGSGGGITGAITSYHLLPNGQVFISDGLMADTTALPSIKKGLAKSLFENADNTFSDSLDFNHPGNIYQFLHYYNEKKEGHVVWGENGIKAPDGVKQLYHTLKSEVSPSDDSN